MANTVAEVNRADDKPGSLGLTSGGRQLPPLFYVTSWQNE
jgi:hypothetical protein